jgi:hypothetical protein
MDDIQLQELFDKYAFRKDQRGDFVKGEYEMWITVFRPRITADEEEQPYDRFMVSTKRSTHATRPIEKLEQYLKTII